MDEVGECCIAKVALSSGNTVLKAAYTSVDIGLDALDVCCKMRCHRLVLRFVLHAYDAAFDILALDTSVLNRYCNLCYCDICSVTRWVECEYLFAIGVYNPVVVNGMVVTVEYNVEARYFASHALRGVFLVAVEH